MKPSWMTWIGSYIVKSLRFLVAKLNHLAKKYANLASTFLARLARSCTKSCTYISCKCYTKHEAFLARSKKSCNDLARKITAKIIFLQDFDQILQQNTLAIFLARSLQDLLATSCKCKICKICARFDARSCKFCKRNTCKTLKPASFYNIEKHV